MNTRGMTLLELAKEMNEEFSLKEISKLTDDQMKEYTDRLEYFKRINSSKSSTEEKRASLEDLVSFLLGVYDNYFHLIPGVRTGTNEIDQVITSKNSIKVMIANNLLDPRFNNFLCECKNYSKKVDVTYVGKFASLLLTTSKQLGILFSYKGVTGTNWQDASGLIKKFYLCKEKTESRFCILDFNIVDFELVKDGYPFFQLLHDKMLALEMDTSITKLISKHPGEDVL